MYQDDHLARKRTTRILHDREPPTPTLDRRESGPAKNPRIIPIGARIEQYEIQGLLGAGGMGTVYLARDLRLHREVAIKLIHTDMVDRADRVESFLAEAQAMARVHHPNVVTIHAMGSWNGQPYFVMEYVDGENLSRWLHHYPHLTTAEVIEVLDALARGVQAIHDAGTVHRDLKPSNVLVSRIRRVAVTDFGLSHSVGRYTSGTNGPMLGTPAFIAPEVARGEVLVPELVTRIDIYALGIIAFELLTGELPFDDDPVTTMSDLLGRHAYMQPPRASARRPRLGPAFDAPLLKALAKHPGDRQASADELRRELRAALRTSVCPTPGAPPGLRVMVVDDDSNARNAIADILMMAFPEAEVITMANATEAAAVAGREPLDLVITDLSMPDGDGRVLTTALRSSEATAHVPIVVMTGFGGAPDWHNLRELGANRFLVKPVELEILVGVVRALTGREPAL